MISFVVPAYNESSRIGLCIVSIQLEADDQGIPYEIIVVDNASTDDTAKIAKNLGVTVIYEPNKGVVRARQAGYLAAKYDLIANIDADNWLPQGWIDCALQELELDDEAVLVSGPIVYLDFSWFMRELALVFYFFGGICNKIVGPMSQGGNSILKKAALKAIGGYNTSIDFYGDDTDLAKRMGKIGKVKFSKKLWSYGSARRFKVEGPITTTFRYVLNYFSVTLFNKPIHKHYQDIREV